MTWRLVEHVTVLIATIERACFVAQRNTREDEVIVLAALELGAGPILGGDGPARLAGLGP